MRRKRATGHVFPLLPQVMHLRPSLTGLSSLQETWRQKYGQPTNTVSTTLPFAGALFRRALMASRIQRRGADHVCGLFRRWIAHLNQRRPLARSYHDTVVDAYECHLLGKIIAAAATAIIFTGLLSLPVPCQNYSGRQQSTRSLGTAWSTA